MNDGFLSGVVVGMCAGASLCILVLALICWGYSMGKEAGAKATTATVEEAQK